MRKIIAVILFVTATELSSLAGARVAIWKWFPAMDIRLLVFGVPFTNNEETKHA